MRKKVIGKPCAGESHARFDEEEMVKSREETISLLYGSRRSVSDDYEVLAGS